MSEEEKVEATAEKVLTEEESQQVAQNAEKKVEALEAETEKAAAELDQLEEKKTERNHRKVRRGYVVSDKMDKTVVVELEDRARHALYGKIVKKTKKVKCHDENNECGVGDLVRIMETRPLSKTKRWRIMTIIEKAK